MDSGWVRLVIEYFKDKGLFIQYHMVHEWFYRWCLFSHHERQSRKARLKELLNLRENVELVRTEAVQWHEKEGFMMLGHQHRDPFQRR